MHFCCIVTNLQSYMTCSLARVGSNLVHSCCKDRPGRLAHCVTMRQCCQVTWCRGSGDEATSIMELYVRAVMSSDDFDKDVFDMEHLKVPCSILQSAFMPIACFACTCTRHPPAHTLHAHPRLTGTNNSSGCASQSNPIDS